MTQLVLDANGNNIALPESRRGGYTVSREDLSRELVAISGRMFKEKRGKVWIVSYQFGYFNEETKNKIIESCEKGQRPTNRLRISSAKQHRGVNVP